MVLIQLIWTVIITMQCLFLYMDREQRLNFCCISLVTFVAYHVTFYAVVETPKLPQVAFNSLIFITTFLFFTFCLESFSENFRFKFSSESCKSTTKEVYQDVNESFCIIRSIFLMWIYIYIYTSRSPPPTWAAHTPYSLLHQQ